MSGFWRAYLRAFGITLIRSILVGVVVGIIFPILAMLWLFAYRPMGAFMQGHPIVLAVLLWAPVGLPIYKAVEWAVEPVYKVVEHGTSYQ